MSYSMAAVQNVGEALESHLKDVVIPILEDNPDRDINQIGTSTLIEHRGMLILLSAMHVFNDVQAVQITVPSDCRGARIVPLWPFEIFVGNDGDDLIALLLNDTVAQELRANWRVVRSQDCRDPRGDHAYAVSGYPSALVKKFGPKMGGTLVTTYTDLIPAAPKGAASPVDERDIFFEYAKDSTKRDGSKMKSPRLNGVSGAGIWEIKNLDELSFWTPQDALNFVGVQTDARHFDYIRGKTWAVVERLLETVAPCAS